MRNQRVQRIRDPVHGLIVFREPLDCLAWQLLDTPEMQRLRRIKQLGLSEFVFPGATHSRFAHSIGVFHMARILVSIIERELMDGAKGKFNPERADVAVLAALLHDIGHGPMSHAFESAERARGQKKRHEVWSAEMISSKTGGIRPLLEKLRPDRPKLAEEIADLLVKEVPDDIYGAVVSSSFDADRLDYLRRDKLMTGSGAGAIDFDWLLDNLTVADIDMEPDGEPGPDEDRRPSFCLRQRAIQAAESFLLARYQLYTQVYFHKTTRGVEQMVSALLSTAAELIQQGHHVQLRLAADHPLVRFLQASKPELEDYLALDDAVIWGAIERMEGAEDRFVQVLAGRLRRRELYKGLDFESAFGPDAESQRRHKRRIDKACKEAIGRTVLRDEPTISIYGAIGADDAKAHKRLMVLMPGDKPTEIVEVSEIDKIAPEKRLIRYYFSDDSARESAKAA